MKTTPLTTSVICTAVLLAGRLIALAGSTICLEAETVDSVATPMRIVVATNAPQTDAQIVVEASGGSYLEVPENAGKPPEVTTGLATLSFSVPKQGNYYLWCRVWWNDQCGNSVSMNIDDNHEFAFGQDSTYECWHWVKSPPRLKQLELSAGKHTLTIKNREDGIRIDQILFTDNHRLVPVGIEKPTP